MKKFSKSPLFLYGLVIIAFLSVIPMVATAFAHPESMLTFAVIGAAVIAINTPERSGAVFNYPLAAETVIWQGTLVALDSSGNCVPASNTVGLKVVGRAEETVDNSAGLAGALTINVKRGVFLYANSASAAVDANDKGAPVYVEDDMTVTETASNSIVAGVCLDVTSEGVWIDTSLMPSQVAAISAGAVGTAELADAGVTPAKTNRVQAVTATTTGATTGTILATTRHATVTSDSADKIVILPAPTPGVQVVLNVAATGFELRSSDPATVAINGGTGADAESAIPANSTVVAICVSATAWKAFFMDADGDVAKVEAAA